VDPGADQHAAGHPDPDAPSASSGTPSGAHSRVEPSADSGTAGRGQPLPPDIARCGCGRVVPVVVVPSFTAAFAGAATKSTLVSLTMPLTTFLGLADQPGRLDGYGPVPAGLARRIAADAAAQQPGWTAWRCVVTDDVHGSVLGVTDPIWTPRHDPPERLARLVTAMEPVCVFPGCRQPAHTARCCDIDHRIPYQPGDPTGQRGGGRTCSCNLQPLCRTHHRQKTAGALQVRAIGRREDPAAPAGTLEWTLPSGVTCRSHPHIADPGPLPTTGPTAHPTAHPAVTAAVTAAAAHLAAEGARDQARDALYADTRNLDDEYAATDWAGHAWQRSRAEAARARAERAQREAERQANANLPPPF
jgi:hypothetical protein